MSRRNSIQNVNVKFMHVLMGHSMFGKRLEDGDLVTKLDLLLLSSMLDEVKINIGAYIFRY